MAFGWFANYRTDLHGESNEIVVEESLAGSFPLAADKRPLRLTL